MKLKDKTLITKTDTYNEAMFFSIVQTVEEYARILNENDKTTINMKQYFYDMCFMLKYIKYLQDYIDTLRAK